jgi:hypothetical protein
MLTTEQPPQNYLTKCGTYCEFNITLTAQSKLAWLGSVVAFCFTPIATPGTIGRSQTL